jgi:hypothetical protein
MLEAIGRFHAGDGAVTEGVIEAVGVAVSNPEPLRRT